MKASDMLPSIDLAQVVSISRQYNVDPKLILAIGWHETQWGKAGDGRYGMYLGYGSYDSGSDYSFAGLVNQVKGAASKMAAWGLTGGNVTLAGLQAGNSGALATGIYASDSNWADSIWSIYQDIEMDGVSYDSSLPSGGGTGGGTRENSYYTNTNDGSSTGGSTGTFFKQVGFLVFSGLIAVGLVYGGVK